MATTTDNLMKLISQADIARALQISPPLFYHWISAGVVPAPTHPTMTGKTFKYTQAEADKVVKMIKERLAVK